MSPTGTAPADLAELRIVLVEAGLIAPDDRLTTLAGGVSSIIARVDGAGAPWVVKAPLARLAVSEEWLADRSRGGNEAQALRLLNGLLGPARVPRLRFFDPELTVLGEEMVPGPPPSYKDELMAGRVRPEVAAKLGAAIATLHRLEPPPELAGLEPRRLFDELRLDPYYRATAIRQPELRPALDTLIAETLAATPWRLVHGDFTPKNVLVTGDGPAVVDWEVIHSGDPAFDLATLSAHLVLKAVRDGPAGGREPLLDCVLQFWRAYDGPADGPRALRHTGAVILARLYGKSRVDYVVGARARRRAERVGRLALAGECADVEQLVAAVGAEHQAADT